MIIRRIATCSCAICAGALTQSTVSRSSAARILKRLLPRGFDVVITDYQLQWADGLSVLQQCLKSHPDIPVIMFTDSGSEEIAVEGMKAGLSDYVLKSHPLGSRSPCRKASKKPVRGALTRG